MPPPRRLTPRKLLVASLGVASISYLGCSPSHPPGNLMQPPSPPDAVGTGSAAPNEVPPTSGNLMVPRPDDVPAKLPDPPPSAQPSAHPSAKPPATGAPTVTLPIKKGPPTSGNLMAPRSSQ